MKPLFFIPMFQRLFFMIALAFLASGCQIFGGGDDEFAEDFSEDDTELAEAEGAFEEAYSEESYGEDAYGAGEDGLADEGMMAGDDLTADSAYSDDTYTTDAADTMGAGPLSASASGSVFFVTSDVAVYSSADGSGEMLFQLTMGDSIRADTQAGGEYASVGYGYVLASALSEAVVERIPTANPWR